MDFKSKYAIGDEVFMFGGDAITSFKIGGVQFGKENLVIYIEETEGKKPMRVLQDFVNTDFNELKETVKAFYKGDCDNMCTQIDKMKKEDLEAKEELELSDEEEFEKLTGKKAK